MAVAGPHQFRVPKVEILILSTVKQPLWFWFTIAVLELNAAPLFPRSQAHPTQCGWSRVKRGTSVSIERSLCVKGSGGTCTPLLSSLCPSTRLLIWFKAPELFSFPHPPRPEFFCYGIGDEVHVF